MSFSHKIINEHVFMSFPYELKDTFRTLFKTAKWNSTQKAFVAAYTPQNLRKWEKFIQAADTANKLLAQKDNEEATVKELEELADAANKLVITLTADLEYARQRSVDVQKNTVRATAQATELQPYITEANERLKCLLEEHTQAAKKRDTIIAPVIRLYEEHDLDDILKKYFSGAVRGYAGKDTLKYAEARFRKLVRDMRRIGSTVDAFDELLYVSLNRPDKVKDLVAGAREKMHSGVRRPNENDAERWESMEA